MLKACKLGCVVHLDSLNMFMSGQNLKVKQDLPVRDTSHELGSHVRYV